MSIFRAAVEPDPEPFANSAGPYVEGHYSGALALGFFVCLAVSPFAACEGPEMIDGRPSWCDDPAATADTGGCTPGVDYAP